MNDSLQQLTSIGDSDPFHSDFLPDCSACIKRNLEIIEKCPIDGRKARHSRVNGTYGEVFGCTKKNGLVVSKSLHQDTLREGLVNLKTLAQYKRKILEHYEKAYKRLLHNVERNDAHIIQEFQNVVPDSILTGAQKGFRGIVSDAVSNDLSASAKALTNIFKAAIAIKNELTIYQRLYVEPIWRPDIGVYKAHKVFMNTAYKFYDEFNETRIWLDVGECYDEVEVDFECVSVVLFHILDNARKYAQPTSDISVKFERDEVTRLLSIRINMVSLTVEPDEVSTIELEGISGRNAQKLGKAGKGIGFAVIRNIVSKAGLSFTSNWGTERIFFGGLPYSQNALTLGGLRIVRTGSAAMVGMIRGHR